MKIYIDAMGGDNAPAEIVKGAVEAAREYSVPIVLVGQEKAVRDALDRYDTQGLPIEILHAESVIGFDEEPVKAVRHKKDSSIVVGLQAVKENPEDVFISAGSTGALLVGAQFILGRIRGIKRPGLGVSIPQGEHSLFAIDVGATSDAKAEYLLQYGQLGAVYCEAVMGIPNPSVGLLNIGSEEEKGSMVVKDAHQMLKASGLNFYGNIEAKDIPTARADVLVCDGFTGNIVLKLTEGLMSFIMSELKKSMMSSFKGKIGGLMIKDDLKEFKKQFDAEEYGGSPFLGVKGGVIKIHGSSKSGAVRCAVRQAILFSENDVVGKITARLEKMRDSGEE